jgi:hypothetical protein
MLLSPVGAGKVEGSAACTAAEKASKVPRTAALRLNRRMVSIISSSCYANVEALDFGYDKTNEATSLSNFGRNAAMRLKFIYKMGFQI